MPEIIGSVIIISLAVASWGWLITQEDKSILDILGEKSTNRDREKYGDLITKLGLTITVEYITGFKYLLTLITSFIVFAMLFFKPIYALLLIPIPVLTWIVPDLWLIWMEKQRIKNLKREFPLFVTHVRVFSRAADLFRAINMSRDPLSGEMRKQLDILTEEMEIYQLKEALERFAERCQYPPVKNFVAVIYFSLTTGTDVDNILGKFGKRTYTNRINEIKRRVKVEPIIMTVIPAIMVFVMMALYVVPMFANVILRLKNFG